MSPRMSTKRTRRPVRTATMNATCWLLVSSGFQTVTRGVTEMPNV